MVRLVYDASLNDARDLDEEALGWVVRLTSGESTQEDHSDFRRWRDQSAEHGRALARARTLWSQLGDALPEVEKRRARGFRHWRKAAAALPLAACLMLSVGVGVQYWRVWRFDAVTPVGRTRAIVLPDGSRAILSGDTALKIDFKSPVRRLELARGEALFEVRHDPKRPFVVHSGAVEVRDIGTVFDIARVGDRAKIVVTQGVVEASDDDQRTVLTANQILSASPGHLGRVAVVDAGAETAWARGHLFLENKTLAEIVDALGPYYPGRIILLNRSASQQRLSAVIELGLIDDWLSALEKAHAIHVDRVGPFTILS